MKLLDRQKRQREIEEMFEGVIGDFAHKHPDWTTIQLAEEFCMSYNSMLKYLRRTNTQRVKGGYWFAKALAAKKV